jgi:hypothetical protein
LPKLIFLGDNLTLSAVVASGWVPVLASEKILVSVACPLAIPPSAYKAAHVAIATAIFRRLEISRRTKWPIEGRPGFVIV